jgi:hypothetical protein
MRRRVAIGVQIGSVRAPYRYSSLSVTPSICIILEASLRFSAAWPGLLEVHESLVEVLVVAAQWRHGHIMLKLMRYAAEADIHSKSAGA